MSVIMLERYIDGCFLSYEEHLIIDTKVVELIFFVFQKNFRVFHFWIKFEELISYQSLTDCGVGGTVLRDAAEVTVIESNKLKTR